MRNTYKKTKIYKRKTYKGGSFPGYGYSQLGYFQPGYSQSQPQGYHKNGLFIAYTPAERQQMYLQQMRAEQMRAEQMRAEQMRAEHIHQMQMRQMQMYHMGYAMPGYGMPMPEYGQAQAQTSASPSLSRSPSPVASPSFQFSPSAGVFSPLAKLNKNNHTRNSANHSSKSKTSMSPKIPRSKSPKSKSPKSPKPEPAAELVESAEVEPNLHDPPAPLKLTRQPTNSYVLYDELLNNSNYRSHMNSAMRELSDYELGPTTVFLRQGREYGVFRVDKKKDNDIYFNWDEIVTKKGKDELVQRCHISLHNSSTDKDVNKSVGSLHVKLDQDGSSKRICVFLVGREFHIAIKDEQMDPMIYTPVDRFAADVVSVLLNYYDNTGRTAMKIDTSFCKDPESGKGKGKGKGFGKGKGKGKGI